LYLFPRVEVEVTLLPTVSRQVSPGVRPPFGTRDQFFFLLDIVFRHLRVYYFLAPSLTRGRVAIHLQLHTHHHPSSGDGRRGQIVADVRSGLSLASTGTLSSFAACKVLRIYLLQTRILLVDGGD
jgi:hypothetical protein